MATQFERRNTEIFSPKQYQTYGIDRVVNESGLLLGYDMGLGKTVTLLTGFAELYDRCEVDKMLVIAPPFVASHTWPEEINKWAHLKGLDYVVVNGDAQQRKEALKKKVNIYLYSVDNLHWLVSLYGKRWPFKMVVIDESDLFKNNNSVRFKSLRHVRKCIDRIYLLSGTAISTGLMDLWPQMYLIDQGKRLYPTIGEFRDDYFKYNKYTYKYTIKHKKAEEEIYSKIKDVFVSLQMDDYLDVPPIITTDIKFKLPPAVQKMYDEYERDLVLALPDDVTLSAANAAVLANKLLQFANGAVYDEFRNVHVMHDIKLQRLQELITENEGKPTIVVYWFKHDFARIKKLYPHAVNIKEPGAIDRWNKKQIPLLCLHSRSAGHGLNLQFGGNTMIWFGNYYSRVLYDQTRARLRRPGQQSIISEYRLITLGTADTRVIAALAGYKNTKDALLNAVKGIISKHRKLAA